MNKEKLKPKLFSVMKTYTKEQFLKDVVAGTSPVYRTCPCFRCRSGGRYLHSHYRRLSNLVFRRKPCPDCRTYRSLCNDRCGDRRQKRNGWSCCRYPNRRRSADPNGCIQTWQSDPFYPIYHYNRFYGRYCCHDRDRAVKGLFRSDL